MKTFFLHIESLNLSKIIFFKYKYNVNLFIMFYKHYSSELELFHVLYTCIIMNFINF